VSGQTRGVLARLAPEDPARHWVEFALETDSPAVAAAVACRLLSEIRAERDRTRGGNPMTPSSPVESDR
jgi:hypothetical protein